MRNLNKKGITLISLVITIIVLLILAGVSIAMLTGENGILSQAQKAKISTELSSYKEQVELFKLKQTTKNNSFIEESLTAGKSNLFYNTQTSEEQGKGTIKDIIENISDEYFEKLEIIKGELLINTKDNVEIKIALGLGIKVNPYDIVDGVLLSTGNNLALMDENGTVTVPDIVEVIGEGSFANSGLKTIIIPGTVKRIEKNAFAHNETLENVIMQEGIEEIGNNAFYNCKNLKNVELPESLMLIETEAFGSCTNLSKIKIPSKIKTISSFTFSGCTNLNEVVLQEGLEQIQSSAFVNTKFSNIEIPSTVTDIGNSVFSGNKSLNNIIIKGNSPYLYESGMLMTKQKDSVLFVSDSYLKNITKFNIPEGIKSFNVNIINYTNITEIVIPSTLQSISSSDLPTTISNIEISGYNSKYEVSEVYKILYTKDTKEIISCFSKEETIDLKDEENNLGILTLASSAFKHATNAKIIILPDSLEKIMGGVFNACQSVQEIRIGAKVSSIDPLFKYTNYSGIVTIDSRNSSYRVENNVLYSKNKDTLICILSRINGRFEIDDEVKIIGNYAFHGQDDMTEVVIPGSVKEIGNSFYNCNRLTNIEIPSSVEKIGGSCFTNCSNLDKIKINKGENEIKEAPWGATKGMKVVEWVGHS